MAGSCKQLVTTSTAIALLAATLAGCGGSVDPPTIEPIDRDEKQEIISNRIAQSTGHLRPHGFEIYPSSNFVQLSPSGSGYIGLTQSRWNNRYAYAIPWRDSNNALRFSAAMEGEIPEQEEGPIDLQGRGIITTSDNLSRILDRDLGQHSQIDWQAFSVTQDYAGDGTLDIQIVTDLEDTEAPGQPWVGYGASSETISLDAIPSLAAGHDWQRLDIEAGDDPLTGSLSGVEGTFSCFGSEPCSLEYNRNTSTTGYYPSGGTVTFTPSDGSSPVTLPASPSAVVPRVDYLTFGVWLYVPDNIEDSVSYDFGVFAGGGDPFDHNNGVALTGSATYVGDATGMYYTTVFASDIGTPSANVAGALNVSTPVPIALTTPALPPREAGSFNADVTLTAEFGTDVDLGTLRGRIHNIAFDAADPNFMKELILHETTIHASMVAVGLASDTRENPANATTSVNPNITVLGEWRAAFFGNDPADSSIHPTGVAGTFGASRSSEYSAFGLVGAFGAHKQ